MMKRLVSLIIVLLLTFPAAAYAEEVKECDDWRYIVHDDGTARIVSYQGAEEYVVVPDNVDGYTVTGFSDYISGQDYGFQLTSVVSLVLPDSFTAIDSEAPLLFSRLTNYLVDPNHPTFKTIDGVIFNKEGTELLFYPPAREADVYRIPDGVKKIRPGAFDFTIARIGKLVCPDSLRYSLSLDASHMSAVEEIIFIDTSYLCRFCDGVGKIDCPYCFDGLCADCCGDLFFEEIECNLCNGWGLCRIDCNKGVIDCKYCNGSGYNVAGEALEEARLSED